MFCSGSGDTVTVNVHEVHYSFSQERNMRVSNYGMENASLFIGADIDGRKISLNMHAAYRETLDIDLDYNDYDGHHYLAFYEDSVDDISLFGTMLADTLLLAGSDSGVGEKGVKCSAVLVNGLGITSFTIGERTWRVIK